MAEDNVEVGESVAWIEEPELDSEKIDNEHIEEEEEEEEERQDDSVPDEEAWNTVITADEEMENEVAPQYDGVLEDVADDEGVKVILSCDMIQRRKPGPGQKRTTS